MTHDEQTEEEKKARHEEIFYSKLSGSKNGEKLALKFTRSEIFMTLFFSLTRNMILLLLLRMQKLRFDVTEI